MTRKDFFKSLAALCFVPVVLKSKHDGEVAVSDVKRWAASLPEPYKVNYQNIKDGILVYWEKYDSDTMKVKFFDKDGFYDDHECVITEKTLRITDISVDVGFICEEFKGQCSFGNNPFLWRGGWIQPDSITIEPFNYKRDEYFDPTLMERIGMQIGQDETDAMFAEALSNPELYF